MVRCAHLGAVSESQYLLNTALSNPIVNNWDQQIVDQTNVASSQAKYTEWENRTLKPRGFVDGDCFFNTYRWQARP